MIQNRIVTAAMLVAALAAACGDDGSADGGGSGRSDDGTASIVEPVAGAELYADDFETDTGDWDAVEGEDGTAQLEDGDYVWRFVSGSEPRPHLLPTSVGEQFDAGELDMVDVVVRAEVTQEQGGAAFGLFCRDSRDTDADFQWYEFVVRDGFGAIRLSDTEGNIEVLASTDELSVPQGELIELEAGCVDADGIAHLTLAVDGEPILAAEHDAPLGSGAPGLQGYEAENSDDPTLIRWHGFTVAAGTPG